MQVKTETDLTNDLEKQLNSLENLKRRVTNDPPDSDAEKRHQKHLAEARDAVIRTIESLIDGRIEHGDTDTLLSIASRARGNH